MFLVKALLISNFFKPLIIYVLLTLEILLLRLSIVLSQIALFIGHLI